MYLSDYNDRKQAEKAIASYGYLPGHMNYSRTFQNIRSNTVRSSFNRSDYDYYRPGEGIPRTVEGSIEMCNKAYINVSIVRSIIDMMADFTVQGIRIEHRNRQIQNFLNEWKDFVNFDSISERIANVIYRLGNCPIQITYGKVPVSIENKWKKSSADIHLEKQKVEKKRIPLKYGILNPLLLDVIGGDLSVFVGDPVYGLRINNFNNEIEKLKQLKNKLNNSEIKLNIDLPSDKVININGRTLIPFPSENIKVLFYKKDDWLTWAWPMIHAILDPIFRLEKMHLADDKALDGAISQIRLWTLGNFEYKVYPSAAAINKLRDTLANIGSGDVMDVIWGPELTFKESDAKGYNFLDPKKYTQVMTEIYAGLGVPPSLTGNDGNQGISNNTIAMKALVERLEYGRKILTNFWNEQLKILQTAFQWKHAPRISFDHQVMTDDVMERKIMLDLFDRNVISLEKLRQLCRQDPVLEEMRVKREHKKIQSGQLPQKAGPYHSANLENDLKKIILQSGGVAPSELGIELKERKPGEKTLLEQKLNLETKKVNVPESKIKGTPGQGRPVGSKDTMKRQRRPRPKMATAECSICHFDTITKEGKRYCPSCNTYENISSTNFVEIFNWANAAQDKINDMLTDFFLNYTNKKNLRSLTKTESQQFEKLKLLVFSNFNPFDNITYETIIPKLEGAISSDLLYYINYFTKQFKKKYDREPTLVEMRQIQSSAYALLNETLN